MNHSAPSGPGGEVGGLAVAREAGGEAWWTWPAGVMRPSAPGLPATVNQRLPSAPSAMPAARGPLPAPEGKLVIVPSGVIRPSVAGLPASVNQTAPSGPAAIAPGCAPPGRPGGELLHGGGGRRGRGGEQQAGREQAGQDARQTRHDRLFGRRAEGASRSGSAWTAIRRGARPIAAAPVRAADTAAQAAARELRRRAAGAGTARRRAARRRRASTIPSPSRRRPSVTARDDAALALDQARHRLVDRVGGQQVPGRHGVVLADAVAAVLGLVVHRRGPLELQEGDVGGAGERDALGGHARRADDQRRPVRVLEGLHGRLARLHLVAAEQVQRVREALEHGVLHLDVVGEDDQRLARGEEVVDPRQRGVQLAARGQALERAELGEALGAQRRGDLRVELAQVQRLLAQPGDHVLLGQPVLALVVERHGHDDLALGRAAGAGPRTSAGARSSGGAGASAGAPRSAGPGTGARSARPSRSPPAGR